MARAYSRGGQQILIGGSRGTSRFRDPPASPDASGFPGAGLVSLAGLRPTASNGVVSTSSLGLGLGEVADWQEVRFLDRAKQSRQWTQSDYNTVPDAYIDANGDLISLPPGYTQVLLIFCAAGTYYPHRAGRFRAWWDGEATVGTFGVTNVTTLSSNMIEFDATFQNGHELKVTPTNPANMPRNFRIVRTDQLALHEAGQIFDPGYLAMLQAAQPSCLRFMDWMKTNGSSVANWSDYVGMTAQSWRVRVPFEAMVSLCNTLQCDGWFCIPHLATDDFITQMATYLRDNMDPGLKIRIEYSNELWNDGTFGGTTGQATYAKNQALALWGVSESNFAWCQWAAKRFVEACAIFDTVFAGQTDRLIRVLATQTGYLARIDLTGRAPLWEQNDPANYVAPHSVADEISVAPYFANDTLATNATAIKAALDVSVSNAVAQIKSYMPAAVSSTKANIDYSFQYPNQWGKPLTAYEYNQHMNASSAAGTVLYSGGSPVPGLMTALDEVYYSQEIADAQDELRAYFKAGGGTLMCVYVDVLSTSTSGGWGFKRHTEDTNPVWTALVDWHAANPKWW